MRKASTLLAAIVFSLAATACSEDPTGGDLFGAGSMSAVIDGQPWTATSIVAVRTTAAATLTGIDGTGLAITIFFEPGPSDLYTVNENTPHDLEVAQGAQTWSASETGGAGTITMSTLSPARGVGDFTFTAVIVGGVGSPQTTVVTQGMFDVRW